MDQERTLAIGPFLAELHQRLDQLGPDGVAAAIDAHARSLRPSERLGFLAIFDQGTGDGTEPILERIEALSATLADLDPPMWSRRRWWDDDDDSPAESAEVDDLLIALGERFIAGDLDLARTGYQNLFDLLVSSLDHDRGIALTPDADLASEARDRLVWCLATSGAGDPHELAARIVEVVDDTSLVVPPTHLEAFLRAHPDREAIADDQLAAIAEAATAALASPETWRRRRWAALTAEIHEHLGGIDRVLELARSSGPAALDTYRWLVERLVTDHDLVRAAAVADEALESCRDSWPLAELADQAAWIHHQVGSSDRAAGAAARAWRAAPSITRLEVLLELDPDTAGGSGDADTLSDPHLGVATALVSGDLDGALERADRSTAHVVSDADVSVILAVTAACWHAAGDSRPPHLEDALDQACRSGSRIDRLANLVPGSRPDRTIEHRPLAVHVREALTAIGHEPARLDMAARLLDQMAERVLGAKARNSYGKVAELVIVLGMAQEAIGAGSVDQLTADFDLRYRRFSAFRRELAAARSRLVI